MADFITDVDKYGDKYNSLLAKTLTEIDKEIYAIIKPIKSGKVSLKGRLAYLLENRKTIIDRLKNDTKINFSEATKGGYKKAFQDVERTYKKLKITVPFLETDLEAFKLIKTNALNEMMYHATIDSQQIFQSMVNYSLTGNLKALQTSVLKNLDALKIARYGKTIVDSSLSVFYRTVGGTKGIRAGIEKYRYDGPAPDRIFCTPLIHRVFTMEEINMMDNHQKGMGDVFFCCGGWNCRHRWTPMQ